MKPNQNNSGFNYFQNANAEANAVKTGFLVRQYEYSVILEDLQRHPGKGSVQHYLILGRRGSGKSTLLRRIQVEIDTDARLSSYYIALNLAEEQANIYRLFDLLEEIVRELESQGFDVEWPVAEDDLTYTSRLLSVIHEALQSVEKKLVLLLDNIDRVFENFGGDAALLRAYLQNYGDIKLIGGSTRMTEHFWAYDQPFYEFFRILHLQPLDKKEVRDLLLNWSDKLGSPLLREFIENKPGQLETIRILTDGLPRTLQFFVDILLGQDAETGYDYVRRIMDKVTPLYQERLNYLPPQQRKIVLQLAFCWEAVGTGELAKASRMENRLVSAQLNQLIDKGVVEKIETDTKNHLYRLSERFFNLWLIFTQGSPKEKRRAKFLTIFLENFYDEEELIERATQHWKMLKEKVVSPDKAALLTKAYSQASFIPSWLRDSLIERTRELSDITIFLKNELPLTVEEIGREAGRFAAREEWDKAESLIQTIEQEDGSREYFLGGLAQAKNDLSSAKEFLALALKKGMDAAAIWLAEIYYDEHVYDLAEEYAEIGLQANHDECAKVLVLSYYARNKNKKKALLLFEQFIKQNPQDQLAFSLLAVLQAWNGRFKEMEETLHDIVGSEDSIQPSTLLELLVHHQESYILNLFDTGAFDAIAIDKIFPVIFVVRKLLKQPIVRRLPPELDEPVSKIQLRIYQQRDFYYGTKEVAAYLAKGKSRSKKAR